MTKIEQRDCDEEAALELQQDEALIKCEERRMPAGGESELLCCVRTRFSRSADDEDESEIRMARRNALFSELKDLQHSYNERHGGDPISIHILNPEVEDTVQGKRLQTTPSELNSKALICEVNGVLWDMSRPLEGDCTVQFFDFDSPQGRDTFWHSSAHILGQALERLFNCKLCIGPCTTKVEGFYYEAYFPDGRTINQDDFHAINTTAEAIAKEHQPFERIEVTRAQALELFADNPFKVEIINKLPEEAAITAYRCGPLVDLCRGPHLPNTSRVQAFTCLKASSSYWEANKDRESLQRVYGISFPHAKELKAHLKLLEEAKKRSHHILGESQQLFFFNPLSPGSAFFLPKGAAIYLKLLELMRSQYRSRGFQEVISPNIYNMALWDQSGHAAHYREDMFLFEVGNEEFALKPMNCPGHCLIFKERSRSYRELPLRLAEFGVLHRNEASGALSGLTRVRRFVQDDAHIFCRLSQVSSEVERCLEFLRYIYNLFGFTYEIGLSTRPNTYLGDVATWDVAEAALANALDAHGLPWKKNEGDGAFYGPKIDILVSDALNRKFQCGTIQLDFNLPSRFDLKYTAEGDVKIERPVMIHRAILGSAERMFAILLEHYAAKWPFWLNSRQAVVIPISEKNNAYAATVRDKFFAKGFDVDLDFSNKTLNYKIREAEKLHYNYSLVVGHDEEITGKITVRKRGEGKKESQRQLSVEELLEEFRGLNDVVRVQAFTCLKASSSYWEANKDRESLQRVYGISFPHALELKAHLKLLEEGKKRSHHILGESQQLFFFNPLSPGSAFFLPKGAAIYLKLLELMRSQYRSRGFQEVISPNIYNMALWDQSGHAAHYREDMFLFEVGNEEFAMKPMNCPGHCLVFKERSRSYRELPLRLAEFGVLHRNEASGALSGLTRVRRFVQDDAHIFCRLSQVSSEVERCLEFLRYIYDLFGFTYEIGLSTRPNTYLGDVATWDVAEAALANALDAHGLPWKKNEGDGAFYGPKIDILVSDALNRKFQCGTIQLDFNLPARFDLKYTAEGDVKIERPVMIHRAILGSAERMFAILLEHYAAKWPFWLNSRQAVVIPISEKNNAYAATVRDKLVAKGFDVDLDFSNKTLNYKIREAEKLHYNYSLVVGHDEERTGKITVQKRGEGKKESQRQVSVEELLEEFRGLNDVVRA